MTGTTDGRVEITIRDVYDAQQDSSRQLTAIGTQLATLTTRVDTRLDSGQATMADHEARLRALERFRYTLLGAAVAASAISSALAALIVWALGHH